MTRLMSALRLELTLQNPAEVPARGRLLRAHLAGRAAADARQPAPGRRALRPRRRCLHHRVLLHRRHSCSSKSRSAPSARSISTPLRFWEYLVAKLTVLVADLPARRGDRGHGCPRVRLPSGAAGDRRRARNAGDAADGIHLLAAIRLSDRLVPVGDRPACGDKSADSVLLRPVAEPGAVPNPFAGAPAAARGGVRSGDPGAMAGDVRGGSIRLCAWRVCAGRRRRCSAATLSSGQGVL